MRLFEYLPALSERVIVAGAGGTLGCALRAIPVAFRGVDVLACNYAICAPWPEPERVWWLVCDVAACLCDWFPAALRRAVPARTIMSVGLAQACYGNGPPAGLRLFSLGPHLSLPPDGAVLPGELRGGASVTGLAAQLAYHCGSRQISYAGVDMRGDSYWDGSRQPLYQDGHWNGHRRHLDRLNRWLIDNGVGVDSLTASELEVARG